ncbi:hypothetical protein GGR56DRAFT_47551 [Xylariaceae sp. FL0804]|nr:hypothetical protein GGR56DRAFT_47551 [Xylariaceae sp. FL0804]
MIRFARLPLSSRVLLEGLHSLCLLTAEDSKFSEYDPVRCEHYAAFAHRLKRVHFDALYWTFFFLVIFALFLSSWIYQRTIMFKDRPSYDEDAFRRKLRRALACSAATFLVAAVLIVMEVYALLALQFCDGEDLMSLYWATWTAFQLGAEIAILGVILALWHHLRDIRHPLWALALGTPVLVVAGFGHVFALALESVARKCRTRYRHRYASDDEESNVSSNNTAQEKDNRRSSSPPGTSRHHEQQERSERTLYPTSTCTDRQELFFSIDVGDDERVRQWPSFVGMADGRAVVQLTAHPGPPA